MLASASWKQPEDQTVPQYPTLFLSLSLSLFIKQKMEEWWELSLLQPKPQLDSLLTNKTHRSLFPTPLPLPIPRPASAVGLVLWWSRLTVPYLPTHLFAWDLTPVAGLFFANQRPSFVLAFSQILLKTRPVERSCCAFFSQPATLLIIFLGKR
jgi:hypothetical protein